jgi:fatty-acyl-CoA synthase
MLTNVLLTDAAPGAGDVLRELSVGDALREAARKDPDQLALVHRPSGTRLTYSELLHRSERVGRALLTTFRPGEHIAVCTPNVAEFLLLQFGAALAGMVIVPVPPALRSRDLGHVLSASHAAGVFFAEWFRGVCLAELIGELRDQLPELRVAISLEEWGTFLDGARDAPLPSVSPGSPSQIQFTSGTTGAPKGAVLHHRGIVNTARFVARDLELTSEDVWLGCMPLSYIAGCAITVLAVLEAHATLVLCDFEPSAVLELIESEKATVMMAAAAMLQMLVDHADLGKRDLSSLRAVSVGGSTIPPELARRVQVALGAPLAVVYGLTEACGVVAQTRLDDPDVERTQTIGRLHPHVEARIADAETGAAVPPGTAGELWLRGYFVMDGYLDQPQATRDAVDAAGWLRTGDLATADERGYLRITGRLKEIVNRGGRKIAPGEIEAVLAGHPAVALCAVVGVPDERLGEEIAAFIQLAPERETTQQELAAVCDQELAPFKRPRHWIFVDELPLTRSGKVHKPSLRDAFRP